MSNEITKDSVIQNKKEAIKSLNKLLEGYINDPSGSHLKKANLISYWIKDYVRMINFEERFNPTKNISYKRGNVVKIDFGFNIGAEYGGLHYGVVLDNNNAHNSPVVTVIPLTSVKEEKETHSNSVELGNDIYRLLKLKYDTISKSLEEEQLEIKEALALFNTMVTLAEKSLTEAEGCEHGSEEFTQKLITTEDNLKIAKKIRDTWNKKTAA